MIERIRMFISSHKLRIDDKEMFMTVLKFTGNVESDSDIRHANFSSDGATFSEFQKFVHSEED